MFFLFLICRKTNRVIFISQSWAVWGFVIFADELSRIFSAFDMDLEFESSSLRNQWISSVIPLFFFQSDFEQKNVLAANCYNMWHRHRVILVSTIWWKLRSAVRNCKKLFFNFVTPYGIAQSNIFCTNMIQFLSVVISLI